MLAGDELCTQVLRSADYRAVLDSIEADALESEAAAFAELPPGQPLELLIGQNRAEASSALEQLRLWLRGAKRAIVCDPYFFPRPQKIRYFHRMRITPEQFCGSLVRR